MPTSSFCRPVVLTASLMILAANSAHAQSVTDLWNNNCASCHGETGKGGGGGTSTLLDDKWLTKGTDRDLFNSIKEGHPDQGMEAFGQTLKNNQIWSLVNYLYELRARDRRQREGSPKDVNGVYQSKHHAFRLETVIKSDLDVPWSVDFLPDGALIVTNRDGDLNLFKDGKLSPPIKGTPKVRNRGQGGLMDVALHPQFATNGWIYLAYSDPHETSGSNTGMTKIVRGRIVNNAWTEQQTIFEAKPEHYLPTDIHFGSRIVFQAPQSAGPDAATQANGRQLLFFSIGERGRMENAQDLTRPNGKVHRLWDDGQVPADNPFVGTPNAYESIWSFGHRNPQGLAFDLNNTLWDTEHGPRGGDELNIVLRGRNYGWPLVSFGINYNGAPFKTPFPDLEGLADGGTGTAPGGNSDGIIMPVFHWSPSIGACGLSLAHGPMFSNWKGDLIAGGLSGANVDRIRIKDGKLAEREELLHGLGRVRDVTTAPDGSIYVVLNDPDQVLRLVEAGK